MELPRFPRIPILRGSLLNLESKHAFKALKYFTKTPG